MCGIAGFIDVTRTRTRDDLARMTDALAHRGPDDAGLFFSEHASLTAALGHRRLSIIDLSRNGHQPMMFNNWVVVYNGELYNYQTVKTELQALGYSFTSTSDTEVFLKAFHHFGISCLAKFNGMFAMALFNQVTHELFLIRDRIGVKPLYYSLHQEGISFASELKSMMRHPGFSRQLNPRALSDFLYHGYIPAPHTIFKDTFKLPAGTYLHWKDGKVAQHTYWNLHEHYLSAKNISVSEQEALDALDALVTDSVKLRLVSDVPVGTFLSGGYDSSLVTAVMQKVSSSPVQTFTVGFTEQAFDESAHARAVAKHVGTDHHQLMLSVEEARRLIPEIPQHYDEPFADSSQLPMLLVSRFARQKVKVVLSGDGGDELFCGYRTYEQLLKNARYEPWAKALAPVRHWLRNVPRYEKIQYFDSPVNMINAGYLRALPLIQKLLSNGRVPANADYLATAAWSKNIQEANMLQDMKLYLPDDILVKVDRATMSCGLEGREPLLDYRLFDFSFTLPHTLKFRNGTGKYLLKELTHRYIPRSIMERPKQGFAVPVLPWLLGEMTDLVDELTSPDRLKKQRLFNEAEVQQLVSRFRKTKDPYFGRIVWNLMVFQLWCDHYPITR